MQAAPTGASSPPRTQVKHFRDLFGIKDRLRFLAWSLAGRKSEIQLRLTNGLRLALRPKGDYGNAYEVFVLPHYVFDAGLPPERVSRIVDLGAHCGFSVLFWASRYPNARIVAFEPHPVHAGHLRKHLALNGLEERVKLHQAAVGAAPGEANLSDAGTSSSIVRTTRKDGLRVPVVDLFETLGPEPIDILKMDVEGVEYDLLADPRFAALPIRTLVMEWHTRQGFPDGRTWCADRLVEAGFRIIYDEPDLAGAGILRAHK